MPRQRSLDSDAADQPDLCGPTILYRARTQFLGLERRVSAYIVHPHEPGPHPKHYFWCVGHGSP
eukprot:5455042-Pyramimonas_sp.AAC.1